MITEGILALFFEEMGRGMTFVAFQEISLENYFSKLFYYVILASIVDGPKLRSKHVHHIRFEFSFAIMAPKPFLRCGVCHAVRFKAYCSHIDRVLAREISIFSFSSF